MRTMGIDPGMKRVGIALSDEGGELASPVRTLTRENDASLVTMLAAEARTLGATAVVMGLPVRMNGEEGPEARRARMLAKALGRELGIKVELWDERMTTVAAERELRGVGMRGAKKKGVIDQAAATLLLQSFLDARRHVR